ncbi:unnamed protein product, partial [Schistosoma turkestanicum]
HRQNSSQSLGSNSLGFNFPINSNSSVCAFKYSSSSTVTENNTESNPVNTRNDSLIDQIQMGNLINPTLLNLFGINDTTYFSQIFQNPLAYFMLPMISRLNFDMQANESNLNTPISNQSINHNLSPPIVKQPTSTSNKMKTNHLSDCKTPNDSSDIHLSPPTTTTTQSSNMPNIQNNNKTHHHCEHQTPRVLFCPNCQQLYTSQYLSQLPANSHKSESFVINTNEMTAMNQNIESVNNLSFSNDVAWTLSQLSSVAHRFGLILAAPLVTANGLQYIPVNITPKTLEQYNSEEYQNNKSGNNLKNTNNNRQCTTPVGSCEFIKDSLTGANTTTNNNFSATLSPSTNLFGIKQSDLALPRLMNTSNILDLSAAPSNSHLFNAACSMFNTVNDFRDSQQQQQQQQKHQNSSQSQKKKEHIDMVKELSSSSSGILPNNSSSLKLPCNPPIEELRNDCFPVLLDNQTSMENFNNNIDKNALYAFSQMLLQTNGLSPMNSQTIPFPFTVNQLLLMLYASLANSPMNIQSSLNLNPLFTGPTSNTATNVSSHSVSAPPVSSTNALNAVVKTITDNCDNDTTNNSSFISSIHSNMYRKFPSSSSIPFPPICINPSGSASLSDPLINASNHNTLQNSFPTPTTPMSNLPTAGVLTNLSTHLSQNFTSTSPSMNKLEMNSTGTPISTNNTTVNDNNNNNNSSSIFNLLPALKLLGSIFPQFSTTEQSQQPQQHESQMQPIIADSCSTNSKQNKLSSTRVGNTEQLISPATSPQPTVLRPYLCRFCRTRFQSFSTFQ